MKAKTTKNRIAIKNSNIYKTKYSIIIIFNNLPHNKLQIKPKKIAQKN